VVDVATVFWVNEVLSKKKLASKNLIITCSKICNYSKDFFSKKSLMEFKLENVLVHSFSQILQGTLKGESITVRLTSCLTGLEMCLCAGQTGGQLYSDTSSLSFPW